MRVLSLFDGISCARVALERAWIDVDIYFASEIDKYAKQVSSNNRPDAEHLWDVKTVWLSSLLCDIDLLIWWSPCQDLSIAKNNRKGLDGDRSWLFREYIRILRVLKPKRFILENVASMPKEARDTITKELWVEPIMINAALVSAQNRKRLFWTNIPWITQPQDKGIFLKDILQTDNQEAFIIQKGRWFNKGGEHHEKSPTLSSSAREHNNHLTIRVWQLNKWGQADRIYSVEWKSVCLSANGGGGWAKTWLYAVPVALRNRGEGKKPEYNGTGKANAITTVQTDSMVQENDVIRKLTPIECERLQGLPDDYTAWISNSQRYKCLWNAFNVDVVAHILSFIPR